MTLVEALVAVLIFTVVFLTALALYQAANRAYLQTDAAAIQQQNIRFGMDRMLETLRDSGAGYNTLGSAKVADEQIEGAWESAIFVRGNFDNERETALESTSTAGFAIVTTGNDEIVGYVLRKSGANTVNITIKADLTSTSGTARDANYTSQTSITNEETRTIAVAATTVATQTNPPYELTKVTFDSSGVAQYEVIADNIYRMKFEYYGASGATLAANAVITAAAGTGGADTERDERGAVRRIRVKLIGMADRPDFQYTDPWTYGADFDDLKNTALRPNYHKFALLETVLSSNLGIVGRKHNTVPAITLTPPVSITVCTGHCAYFHVRWPASTATGVTEYSVLVTAPTGGGQPAYSQTFPAIGVLELPFKDPDPTPGVRAFSFSVAAATGGINGSYTAAATLTAANDNTNSIPSAPANVVPSGTVGNALNLTWNGVTTNTGTVTATSYCTSAGSLSGGSAPPSPFNNQAIDLAKYKVYRIRSTGSNNGSFTPTESPAANPNRVDQQSIGTLVNTTPLADQTSFVDHTAAPCSTYFYRVEACDLCDKKTASAAMATSVGPPDPGENPDVPGGVANAMNAVTGTTVEIGNDYETTLHWPAVIRTVSGRPAATAHYKVYRKVRLFGQTTFSLDTQGTNPIDVYETNGVNPLTVVDTQPTKRTGRQAFYEYWVAAVYTGCGRESDWAGPYTTTNCAASNDITITVPAAGAEISIPFESGFTPEVTVEGTGTISKAVATITGPDGSNNVVWSSAKTGAGPDFIFDPFNTAPSLPTGDYLFNVYAIVDDCITATKSRLIELGDATCGLSATNMALTPSSGSDKFYQLSFNVQNTCDPNLGGLDFTVTGMKLKWSGFGGSKTILEARLASATGTLLTSTPLNKASDSSFLFLTSPNRAQTIQAGQTSVDKWFIIYSGEMKQNANNATTWSSIIANTTTPANAADEILSGDVTP